MTAEIIVRRPKNKYNDFFRRYQIYINDKLYFDLKRGEEGRATLPEGFYEMIAKIDWCGSKTLKFTAENGGMYEFICQNNVPPFRINEYITSRQDEYLLLEMLNN